MSLDERWRDALIAVLDPQSDGGIRRDAEAFLQHYRTASSAEACIRGLQHPCTEAEAQFLSSTLASICRKKALPHELIQTSSRLAEMLNSSPFSSTVKSHLASAIVLCYIRGDLSPEAIMGSIFKQHPWSSPPPLLMLLQALSYEVSNKQTSIRPDRRSQITAALRDAGDVADFLAGALRSGAYFEQAVSTLDEYSASFGPPPGLEQHCDVLLLISRCVFHPPASQIAASCLCSLFAYADGRAVNEALLHSLLSQWQQAADSSFLTSLSVHQDELLDGYNWMQEEVVLSSTAQVLSAAAIALCSHSSGQYQAQLSDILGQLIMLIACSLDDVALIATSFYSETYLPSLNTYLLSSPSERDVIMSQHSQLLQRLTEALIYRARLKTEEALIATADARDIGDDAKNVRRELTSTLKLIGSIVGYSSMTMFVLSMAEREFNHLNVGAKPWTVLEACLYSANVCVGCWLAREGNAHGDAGSVDSDEEILTSRGSAPTHEPSSESEASISKLLFLAASCSNHQNGSAKLSGTALTLIGGLSSWSGFLGGQQSSLLLTVQEAILGSIKSIDPKLSRNGATTFQRLCSNCALSSHLMSRSPQWINAIASHYLERGGLVRKAGLHEDDSAEEIVLMTLSKLACLGEDVSKSFGLLANLASPQINAIRRENRLADPSALCHSIDIISALIIHCSGKIEAPRALGQHIRGHLKEAVKLNSQMMSMPPILNSIGHLLSACIQACLVNKDRPFAGQELSEAVDFMAVVHAPLFFTLPRLTELICVSLECPADTDAHDQLPTAPHNPELVQHLQSIAVRMIDIGSTEITRLCSSRGDLDTSLIRSFVQIITVCLNRSISHVFEPQERLELITSATICMCIGSREVEGCHSALSWCEAIFKATYSSDPSASPAKVKTASSFRSWLDASGQGPRLFQGLYLAALTMPSVLIMKVSSSLQVILSSVGPDLFISWSLSAFLLPSPLGSMPPWQGLKPETRAEVLHELTGVAGNDLNRFKRIVKLLTGGKKKGESSK